MYTYYMYQLFVQSEIRLYNLPTKEGAADVIIRRRKSSENEAELFPKDCTFKTLPNSTYIHGSAGRIVIRNGTEIIFEQAPDAEEGDIRALICGWGMAFLLDQRGNTIIHGSALVKNGKALIISGASGSGKSTVSLELIQRGYQYLADDITVIKEQNGFWVLPSHPTQKVCRNVAGQLDSSLLEYINEASDKFSYINNISFFDRPVKAATLVHLLTGDIEELHTETCTGLRRYLNTLECLFLGEIYVTAGTPDKDKFHCLKLAEQMDVVKIVRPKTKDTLNEIVTFIANYFEEG